MIELEFSFEYRNFYIEGMPLDQTENGHPEDGITYTSYVYFQNKIMIILKIISLTFVNLMILQKN